MSFLFIQEMEKLQLKHIGPYLPYGLQVQIIETGNNRKLISVNANESVVLAAADLNPFSFPRCKPVTGIKPILRPLSDLYKEIDGVVGIVELAKIANGIDWNKRGWELSDLNEVSINQDGGVISFSFNKGNFSLKYRAKTKLNYTTWTVLNQLDLFAYLFQHHYDVYGLIDKGLAIDINTVHP